MLKHLIFITCLSCTQANESITFDWDETPVTPKAEVRPSTPVSPSPPGFPSPGFDPMSRMQSMMQQIFGTDPFQMMNIPAMPQPAGVPKGKIQVKETRKFYVAEIPIEPDTDPQSVQFSVNHQTLTVTTSHENSTQESSDGRQSYSRSISRSSYSTQLPGPVKPQMTRQDYKDKIVLTFEKL